MWDAVSETWGPESMFPNQFVYPHPDIAVDPDNDDIHLAYYDMIDSNLEIMYKHYDAGLGSWDPTLQLTEGYPDGRYDPRIALDPDGAVHIAWFDYRNLIDHQEEIYYTTNMSQSGVDESPFALSTPISASPNPFRGGTEIRWKQTPGQAPAALGIYDIHGRLINRISASSDRNGRVSCRWKGFDRLGGGCPPGVYFIQSIDGAIHRPIKVVKLN
jgi:hypothetical protein